MIRLGVLGAGSHSSELHGVAMKLLMDADPGRFTIGAVCDIDAARAERYKQRFGADAAYTDLDKMLAAERFDAFLAITPIALTEQIVSDLLPRLGVPILIEKPPGQGSAGAMRLRDLAARHDVRHMVSFNRRFAPALCKAREWIAESPVERKPLSVVARMLRKSRTEPTFVPETGIHQIDAVLSIMGKPVQVDAVRVPTGKEGVDVVHHRITFDDGCVASGLIAPDAGALAETYEIIGSEYSMLLDVLGGSLRIRSQGEEVFAWNVDPDAPFVEANGTVAETEAFLRALEGRGPWTPTLADSIDTMRTVEAVDVGGTHAIG